MPEKRHQTRLRLAIRVIRNRGQSGLPIGSTGISRNIQSVIDLILRNLGLSVECPSGMPGLLSDLQAAASTADP